MTDTPNRPPLSPAAQAVSDASHEAWVTKDDPWSIAAAALRAAADHTEAESIWKGHPEHAGVRWAADEWRAIAAQLEGANG